jgi:CDP-diacylglycerol pyrophosphatase
MPAEPRALPGQRHRGTRRQDSAEALAKTNRLRSPHAQELIGFPFVQRRPLLFSSMVISMISKRLLFSAIVLVGAMGTVVAAERGLLWSVVQVCVTNHQLTGASFPCLDVNTDQGLAKGFATIRAPLARTHIIVSPTVRIIGIEAPELQSPDAANYFQYAWEARSHVIAAAEHPLKDADIGMAINSRPGRSQDQLHIHVDCLRRRYAQQLHLHDSAVRSDRWSRLPFAFRGRYYWALLLNAADLSRTNIFRTAATLLQTSPGRMEDMTLVVVPRLGTGFYLLADQYAPGAMGKGHGEFLLDHSCA